MSSSLTLTLISPRLSGVLVQQRITARVLQIRGTTRPVADRRRDLRHERLRIRHRCEDTFHLNSIAGRTGRGAVQPRPNCSDVWRLKRFRSQRLAPRSTCHAQ